MKVQGKLLNKLRIMLLASCHAEGCLRISTCPNLCGCRSRRTFKLNTETAICWEIAHRLWNLIGSGMNDPLKAEVVDLIAATKGYWNIARFHMTKGWDNFFHSVYSCICALTIDPHDYKEHYGDEEAINKMKGILKQLKRYPRE